MDLTHRATPSRKRPAEQGEQRRRPPPRQFGAAGLPPAVPAAAPAGDLLSPVGAYVQGASPLLCSDISFQSECEFLEKALAMPPPAHIANLQPSAVPAATVLQSAGLEAMQAMLQQPGSFVAGQLFSRADAWLSRLQPSSYVRRWILDGYSEYLHTLPAAIWQQNSPSCAKDAAFVEQEVCALLACQAIEDVTSVQHDVQQVTAVLPLLVARAPPRRDRVCWNGRAINACMDPPAFKLEHAPKAAAMMRPGDFMFTVDMKSGYHQIPLKPTFRRFCCFQWTGRVYRWRVMPFGLSSAPRAYTKISRCMVAYWRAQGIRVSNYIDDFIFFASSMEEALQLRDTVLQDMASFGWHISLPKSYLVPAQRILYLGFEFCSIPVCCVFVPASKVVKLQRLLGRALRRHGCGRPLSCLGVARITGTLQSMRFAMQPVNLFTRALYRWQSAFQRDGAGHISYSSKALLSAAAALELQFWSVQLEHWNGATLRPGMFSSVLYTDASGAGWGGLVQRVSQRTEEPAVLLASHMWDSIASVDSVFTELQGLHDALQVFAHELAGTYVLHRTDSISTYWVVANAGSRSSERLSMLARQIWLICMQYAISLSSEYVGKDVIIQKGADLLSRWQDDSDCSLHPEIFKQLWDAVGPFDVDRFASAANVQSNPYTHECLPFNCRFLEKGCLGMDACLASWEGVSNYAFPPPSILDRVVQHIAVGRADTLLICPRWPSQIWWPLLLSLQPVEFSLPVGTQPFVPGGSGCHHPCGKGFENADSLRFSAFWIQFS